MHPEYSMKTQSMCAVPPVLRPNLAIPSGMSHRADLVRQFALFSGIAKDDCAQVVSRAQERCFLPRRTIFSQGDPIGHVVLVLSGCVKITQLGPNGQEVILRINGPGEILGLCTKRSHGSTAQTVEPTVILMWEASHFEAACERFPLLRHNAARALEQRLNDMDARFCEVSTKKVSPRLSSELLRLLHQIGKRTDGQVKIALSRKELAQLTGTTLFTVSRLLCRWETLGIVSARREAVLVRDLPTLVELSQEE